MNKMKSEGEFDLRFQAPVVGGFVKTFAVLPACNLVCGAEVGRSDVADDGAGIGMV
jgi:hypothetical protein